MESQRIRKKKNYYAKEPKEDTENRKVKKKKPQMHRWKTNALIIGLELWKSEGLEPEKTVFLCFRPLGCRNLKSELIIPGD